MPRFSCFTPFGMLRFSSRSSRWESLYRQLVDAYAETFDLTPGNYAEAKFYALSCLSAAGYEMSEQLNAERDPRRLYRLLRQREREYGIVPDPNSMLEERRAEVAARMISAAGSSRNAITIGLQTLLGADFLGLRTTQSGEGLVWPNVNPTSGTVGVFKRTAAETKIAKLTGPAFPGNMWVSYAHPGGGNTAFGVGEVLSLDLENTARAERVTVDEIRTFGGETQFRATFAKPHSVGVSVTTGPALAWSSNYRRYLIVVSDSVATSRRLRGKIHELMNRIVRGSATWAIASPTSPGITGPFRLPTALGTKPLGALSY